MELRRTQHIIPYLLLAEFLWICFSGGSFSFLSNPPFFEIGPDPLYWFFYITTLPKLILNHHWLCLSLDMLMIVLLIMNGMNKLTAVGLRVLLFLLLLLHYITLTAVLGHRNFQSGYVWVAFLWLFEKDISRKWVMESLRYFVLLFYVGSFSLKVYYGGWLNAHHFSEILEQQWLYYAHELSEDFRLGLVSFLSNYAGMAQIIFYVGMLIELIPVIGFFTKRIDRFIFISLMAFHLCIWLIMDIAPIGQMSLLLLFFLSQPDDYPDKLN